MAGTAGIHVAMGDTVVAASMTNGGRIHNEALFDELRKPEAERDQAVLQRLMDEDDYTTQKAGGVRVGLRPVRGDGRARAAVRRRPLP